MKAPPPHSTTTTSRSACRLFIRTRRQLERVAATDATVLFVGESGVGKELFSSQLHAMSRRSTGPFVAINCAAIPEQLVESELFGVEKGAYTGAIASRAGYFERASGGTLFLDEIASVTYSAQGKVLRALQERKVERVGGTKTISLDVRVVAASNVDLTVEVAAAASGRISISGSAYSRLLSRRCGSGATTSHS
ncbi:sigma-54 factor interaction domain-containing protein [Bradyrhizobium sp. UFLA05-109]